MPESESSVGFKAELQVNVIRYPYPWYVRAWLLSTGLTVFYTKKFFKALWKVLT